MTSPTPVWDLIDGFCTWGAANALVELGLVGRLVAGPVPVGDLGVDVGRVEPLLTLLAGCGLTTRSDAGWTVPDPGALMLLVRAPGPGASWLDLATTVRAGRPTVAVDDDPVAFYGPLVAATAPVQRAVADVIVAGLELPPGAAVLDLGCGAAPWAAAVLGADPTAHATCVDLAGVVEQAAALGERVTLVPGDHLAVELAADAFDLVVVGHVLRSEDDDRAAALVGRAAAAVRPGGVVVVTEYALDDDRLGPPAAVRMAATVAATLRAGRVRTRSELMGLLAAAGLPDAVHHPHPPTDVLVTRRRAKEPS